MLLMRDSGERPFLKMGPRVGRHAAMTEQHGSTRDQMRTLATAAETEPHVSLVVEVGIMDNTIWRRCEERRGDVRPNASECAMSLVNNRLWNLYMRTASAIEQLHQTSITIFACSRFRFRMVEDL